MESCTIGVTVGPGMFSTSVSIFSFLLPLHSTSLPARLVEDALSLDSSIIYSSIQLEVCHHFPLPLVSLQHSWKEIIKECMSGEDMRGAVRKLAPVAQ